MTRFRPRPTLPAAAAAKTASARPARRSRLPRGLAGGLALLLAGCAWAGDYSFDLPDAELKELKASSPYFNRRFGRITVESQVRTDALDEFRGALRDAFFASDAFDGEGEGRLSVQVKVLELTRIGDNFPLSYRARIRYELYDKADKVGAWEIGSYGTSTNFTGNTREGHALTLALQRNIRGFFLTLKSELDPREAAQARAALDRLQGEHQSDQMNASALAGYLVMGGATVVKAVGSAAEATLQVMASPEVASALARAQADQTRMNNQLNAALYPSPRGTAVTSGGDRSASGGNGGTPSGGGGSTGGAGSGASSGRNATAASAGSPAGRGSGGTSTSAAPGASTSSTGAGTSSRGSAASSNDSSARQKQEADERQRQKAEADRKEEQARRDREEAERQRKAKEEAERLAALPRLGGPPNKDGCWIPERNRPWCVVVTKAVVQHGETRVTYRNECAWGVYLGFGNERKDGSWDSGASHLASGASTTWWGGDTGAYRYNFTGSDKSASDWVCAGRDVDPGFHTQLSGLATR